MEYTDDSYIRMCKVTYPGFEAQALGARSGVSPADQGIYSQYSIL
jgi:hypothetical protein